VEVKLLAEENEVYVLTQSGIVSIKSAPCGGVN